MLWLQTIIYLHTYLPMYSLKYLIDMTGVAGSPGSNFYLQLVQSRSITRSPGHFLSGLSAPIQPNFWALESFVPYPYLALRSTYITLTYLLCNSYL